MSELLKYYVQYPSSEGVSKLEMDLEDDRPLSQLVPDVLRVLDRQDEVPKPVVYIPAELDSQEQSSIQISFVTKANGTPTVVTSEQLRWELRQFDHPEYTVLIIESAEIDAGAPVISGKGSSRNPDEVTDQHPTPGRPVAPVRGTQHAHGDRPVPPPPTLTEGRAPATGRRSTAEILRERVVRSLFDQFRRELPGFGGMVSDLVSPALVGSEWRIGFRLHLKSKVESRDGQVTSAEVHPVQLRFPKEFPVQPYEFWYDIKAAGERVAYHPNITTMRKEFNRDTPGYICLWNTEEMTTTSTRLPIQFGVRLLVEELSYRRVNMGPIHELNPVARTERHRGGLPVIDNRPLPVVNLDDDAPVASTIILHRAP